MDRDVTGLRSYIFSAEDYIDLPVDGIVVRAPRKTGPEATDKHRHGHELDSTLMHVHAHTQTQTRYSLASIN